MTDREQDSAALTVPALGRAVAVLDLLAAQGGPLSLADLTKRLGIAKSTLHGLCRSMVSLGLLQAEPAGFCIGPHALNWSAAYLERNDLARAFDRVVADEPRLADYSITLSRLDGNHVTYLACHNAQRPLGFTFRTGMRLPAAFSATGKAILASLPSAERAALLAGPWPAPFTARAAHRMSPALPSSCKSVRRAVFAIDPGEIRVGMTCIGGAIPGPDGRASAGLAISMTDAEVEERGTAHFATLIHALASRLTHHA